MPPGRPLRILVCIKQVPKAQDLQVDPKTQTLKRVGVPSEINPPDANALEFALRMKDRMPAEIVVLSMGPTSFDESLERAVAMGADRAVLRDDPVVLDRHLPAGKGHQTRPKPAVDVVQRRPLQGLAGWVIGSVRLRPSLGGATGHALAAAPDASLSPRATS